MNTDELGFVKNVIYFDGNFYEGDSFEEILSEYDIIGGYHKYDVYCDDYNEFIIAYSVEGYDILKNVSYDCCINCCYNDGLVQVD